MSLPKMPKWRRTARTPKRAAESSASDCENYYLSVAARVHRTDMIVMQLQAMLARCAGTACSQMQRASALARAIKLKEFCYRRSGEGAQQCLFGYECATFPEPPHRQHRRARSGSHKPCQVLHRIYKVVRENLCGGPATTGMSSVAMQVRIGNLNSACDVRRNAL